MTKIEINKLNLWYGKFQALIDINTGIEEKRITAIIGPSGCGKSTLLRAINRMNELKEEVTTSGSIMIDNKDALNSGTDLLDLRRKVGMVFQRPNPFPLSVYKNITFGLDIHGAQSDSSLEEIVQESLSAVLLWDELKDKLKKPALSLSLEQQQRLCIARLLPIKPQILLMDEPCSALDPIATQRVEELMVELKKDYTIVIVTHNMYQAARISDDTGFMLLGKLIEFNPTSQVFTNPESKETEEYIAGMYG